MVTEKECSRCKEVKPAAEFWYHKSAKTLLTSWCKQCSAEYYKTPEQQERKRKYMAGVRKGIRKTARGTNAPCTLEGCDRLVYAKGFCLNHYSKSLRGDPRGMMYSCECSGEEVWQPKACRECTHKRYEERRRQNIPRKYKVLPVTDHGRTCTGCDTFKEWDQFYMSGRGERRMSKCKTCLRKAQQHRRALKKNSASE